MKAGVSKCIDPCRTKRVENVILRSLGNEEYDLDVDKNHHL